MTTRLANGSTLYEFGDYWGQYHIRRELCNLFLEVNPADIVVASRAEGPGCYMPY